jgi:hypothetical protein
VTEHCEYAYILLGVHTYFVCRNPFQDGNKPGLCVEIQFLQRNKHYPLRLLK